VLITVPLYGVSAAVHDAVTSAPGAHAEVMRAIDGLRRDMRSGELRLSTVVVRQNLHEVLDIARLAHSLGVQLDARLPYPMRQTLDDPYADAALRETEIIAHLLDAARSAATDADLALARQLLRDVVPHPCLLFRAEQRSGLPVFPAMDLRERPLLPGTEYRSSDFAHSGDAQPQGDAFAPAVVACPHASRCALATACPGEQFSVYDQLYGLDELSPVRPASSTCSRRTLTSGTTATTRPRGSSSSDAAVCAAATYTATTAMRHPRPAPDAVDTAKPAEDDGVQTGSS
jgi:hypothetical protein